MQQVPLPPMDAPATLYRTVQNGGDDNVQDIVVARGPFLLLAHGLMSVAPADRASLWIRSTVGDMRHDEIETLMRYWNGQTRHAPPPRPARPAVRAPRTPHRARPLRPDS